MKSAETHTKQIFFGKKKKTMHAYSLTYSIQKKLIHNP